MSVRVVARTRLLLPIFIARRRISSIPNNFKALCVKKNGVCSRALSTSEYVGMHFQVTNLSEDKAIRELDDITFEKLSNETLEELAEFFENLGDSGWLSEDCDISLAAGVLTIQLGGDRGTYVINKHSVNKQIWLSSPNSGPKRFDVIDGRWRYSHSGSALYDLLQEEFTAILGMDVDLTHLKYAYIVADADSWAK